MMSRPSRWQRLLESISQVLCVALVDGDADEMLSSWAWRNRSWLVGPIDIVFGERHCKESFSWERDHYKVDRFKNVEDQRS